MESFHWGKHFITNLSEIDQQHRHLVNIINKFGDHLAQNNLIFDEIETVFQELSEYTQYHFYEEEKLMRHIGIDRRHTTPHIVSHHNFLKEVTSLHQGITPENTNAAQYLLEFLIHWLAYHILGTDQNMARQISSIQSGINPAQAYENEERSSDSSTEPLLVALNGLFHQVSKRNKELVLLNQSLETKVAERTKELLEAKRHFELLSLTDVLTKLPNRRFAMNQLISFWNDSLTDNIPLSCMMVDADHFKEINDTHGHSAGDEVLRELSKTLQFAVRTDDIVCRLGGDEFLIICPDTDQEGCLHIAELTRKRVSELCVPTGDCVWQGSISIGIGTRSAAMKNHEDLIKMADRGVYAAKKEGKNCVRVIK